MSDQTSAGSARFKALKAAKDALERLEFFANDNPVCPHCAAVFYVSENEAWRLYEEGEHEVTCGDCEQDFTVSTRVSYSFSTDAQEDGEDDE